MVSVSRILLIFTALPCGCSAWTSPISGLGPQPGISGFSAAEPGFPGRDRRSDQPGSFDSAFKRSIDEVHQDHLPPPGQHPRVARDDETNGRLHEPHPYQTPRVARQVQPRPDLPDLPRVARDVYDGRSRHPDGHPQPGRTWPQPPPRVARQDQPPPNPL